MVGIRDFLTWIPLPRLRFLTGDFNRGSSGGHLGLFGGHLGVIWGSSGVTWWSSGGHLGSFGGHLGVICGHLGSFGDHLGVILQVNLFPRLRCATFLVLLIISQVAAISQVRRFPRLGYVSGEQFPRLPG